MRRRPFGAMSASSARKCALLVEELFRLVAAHPLFKHAQVLGLLADLVERNLVSAPGVFDRLAVDELRSGPALGRAHDQHRPRRPIGAAFFARGLLNGGNAIEDGVEDCCRLLMHHRRIVALEREGLVSVAAHQVFKLGMRNAREHRSGWRSCIH